MAKKCKCKNTIDGIDLLNKRQNILMDGHTYLVGIVKGLSLWHLIKNCFKRGK